MNKTLKKLVLTGVLGLAVCGSTFAAPHGGNGKGRHEPNRAQVRQEAPRNHNKGGNFDRGKKAAPSHHKEAPRVVHHVEHAPAPAPAPAPIPPPAHHETTLHTGDWVTIGAAAVGGIVGGIIGAFAN
jgi:hypothetical protein